MFYRLISDSIGSTSAPNNTMKAQNELQSNENKSEITESNTVCAAQVSAANAVSVLQEICAKNAWPMPEYNQLDRLGSCHEPIFWFSCQILFGTEKIMAKASAKTKQLAKRASAEEVIKILQQKEIPLFSLTETKKVLHF